MLLPLATPGALAHIEAIAAIDGSDGLFIGPGDLSAAMGFLGQPMPPEMVAAIDAAVVRIRAAGRPAGILVGDEAPARHDIDSGCTFVAVGSDIGVLARGAEALAATFTQS